MRKLFLLSLVSISMLGCDNRASESLPILGEKNVDEVTGVLVDYKAPAFAFVNQMGERVTSDDLEGKVYVVDFFFSSCPTICPQMASHLKLIQDHFENENQLRIVSFSIDPKHDTPERLSRYADRFGIDHAKWSLLTGYETDVFELAKDYKIRAFDDSMDEELNLIHDGTFVLIDGARKIRGYYDGLDKVDVKRLIQDVEMLVKSS